MTTMNTQFSHLHVHTEASLLDGLARLKDIFKVAAANGQNTLAVTDHGSMGGLWKAKEAAKAAGVKLAPGVEIYLSVAADGTFGNRFERSYMETSGDLADDSDENEGAVKRKNYYHLTLLATSRAGWDNLVKITNASEQTRWSKYPMADIALLAKHSEGIIALSGCLGGPILGPVAGGNIDLAERNLTTLVETFGKDNLFLEVMEHGIRVETAALPKMYDLGKKHGVALVATNDSHFTNDCDAHAHDAWLALRTLSGKATAEEGVRPLDDPKRYRFTGTGYHLRTTEEMYGLFAPDRPGHGTLTMSGTQLVALRDALENPLLPKMLAPAEVDPDHITVALNWALKGGDIDDPAVEEFILRVEREAFYLNTFGRPAVTENHPRKWWAEACTNSQVIADRVAEDVVPDGNALLPVYPLPAGITDSGRYLKQKVLNGAKVIYGDVLPQEVRDRLNEEWEVIAFMGFEDYFLIVWDLCDWAKSTACIHMKVRDAGPVTCDVDGCDGSKAPILVGPGRGSGAGSMVAYALGITGLDPLRHDLLFERFIERGRSDWPDFDIDFERNRRDDIIDYLEYKWGVGHVAQIGSYGVSKSRRAVKDAARLLGAGRIGAQLTKVIPVEMGNPMGFNDLLDVDNPQSAEFRRILDKGGAEALEVVELAMQFDMVINGASIHACGLVVSDRYLPDLIPLRQNKKTLPDGTERVRLVTQWDSKDCEKFGLLKLDVLALRNLDIMHTAFDYIAEQTGEVITMTSIPDPSDLTNPRVQKAWALLRDGRTAGIFQAEGAAMTQLIQDVQPENEEHLGAIYALFRPGPISAGMPEHYGLRKNGKEAVSYDLYTSDATEAEWLATRLGASYGILAYQESMMLLGTTIAGFDAGQRSTLRRAIGKKDKEKMASIKGDFLEGAPKEFHDEHGTLISPVFRQDTAERIWAMFEGAASYAFNKSHSMAYAYIGYYTAYLKANWPGAYGAAILANTTENDRRVEALLALPAEGIEVLPPDVNLSDVHSKPEGMDKVRIGLAEVAGVSGSGEYVVRARKESGEFANITDLVRRVDVEGKGLPANQVAGLIESGAMDAFGPRLGLATVARLASPALPGPVPAMEWGVIERSARQRHRLGVSLGTHPLVVFAGQIKNWSKVVETPYGVVEEKGIPIGRIPNESGAVVTVIGLLAAFSEGSYKGGRKASIVLEGSKERVDGIMWDKELTEQREIGIPPIGWPVAVTAKVGIREYEQEDDEGNITIVKVRQLTVRRIDTIRLDDPITGGLPANVVVPVLNRVLEVPAAPEALDMPVPEAPLTLEELLAQDEMPDFDVPADPYADEAPETEQHAPRTFTIERGHARRQSDLLFLMPESWKEKNATFTPGRVQGNTHFTYAAADGRVIAQFEVV
ncbi:DNA polymerase III subunit alpha [Microbacterium sp. 77mftsu3.1]|uniref:DNA polymerase III subunit alpha n=1 Tax=Microbacterium sp. 77mftsu3.1 TaxID=1761802 RepID=UPI0003711138|nr:DNA polymerase III subunit alpha [Microbacterium sp. 77mftsu3.1]SDH34926.1 DNA-directed DNA polymerase III (polc) [Microbacterium sp. 77mftsu3.1]